MPTPSRDLDIAIHPRKAGDLPALQRVRRAAFVPVFESFRAIVGPEIARVAFTHADFEQAKLLDEICAAGSRHTVLCVWLKREIVAFVSFTTDSATGIGEIGLNAVDPAHANQGIGTAMYLHVLARMKNLGMSVATVGVGGDASHAPARRAYEKAGFGPGIPSLTLYRLL